MKIDRSGSVLFIPTECINESDQNVFKSRQLNLMLALRYEVYFVSILIYLEDNLLGTDMPIFFCMEMISLSSQIVILQRLIFIPSDWYLILQWFLIYRTFLCIYFSLYLVKVVMTIAVYILYFVMAASHSFYHY